MMSSYASNPGLAGIRDALTPTPSRREHKECGVEGEGHALAIEPRSPEFACDACGATTIEVPEWTDDQTVLECQECGKPLGKIRLILAVLEAALVDNENEPSADELSSGAQGSRRLSH